MTLHKAIKGYEDYLVSTDGRVYSLKRQKYLKGVEDKDGYITISLYKNGKQSTKKVHRLVAGAFIENPENKTQVDHIDRNPKNNNVKNLRWVDNYENSANRDHSKVRAAGLKGAQATKEKCGMPIIEVINDEVSIGYLSLREVPNMTHSTLRYHINKGETDFSVKQCSGNVRHFKTVYTERSEL